MFQCREAVRGWVGGGGGGVGGQCYGSMSSEKITEFINLEVTYSIETGILATRQGFFLLFSKIYLLFQILYLQFNLFCRFNCWGQCKHTILFVVYSVFGIPYIPLQLI